MNRLLIIALLFLSACSTATPSINQPLPESSPILLTGNPTVKSTTCTNPRPQMCTRQFQPVCAKKNTGIVCVTTPCPSIEYVTYSNGCVACSDAKVYSYTEGECRPSPN